MNSANGALFKKAKSLPLPNKRSKTAKKSKSCHSLNKRSKKAKSCPLPNTRSKKSKKTNLSNYENKSLREISDLIFIELLKENKFYRINVAIECFYYIDSILKNVKLNKYRTNDEILDIILQNFMISPKISTKDTSYIRGGANIRKTLYEFVKIIISLAWYGFILITLIHGTQRCGETKTVANLTNNVSRYYLPGTKCEHVKLQYLTKYLYTFLRTIKFDYVIEEIYSISICDEYQHVGQNDELFCSNKDTAYCKFIKTMPFSNNVVSRVNQLNKMMKTITYISASNYNTDVNAIANDAMICYNNVLSPIWLALGSREILEQKRPYLTFLWGALEVLKRMPRERERETTK
jgi:hypothetical protein